MKFNRLLCVISLLMLTSTLTAVPAKMTDMRIFMGKTLRVVFDLNKQTQYRSFQLKNPHRVVIDFKNTTKNFTPPTITDKQSPIKSIRFAKKSSHDLRVVFDLSQPCETNMLQLKPNDTKSHRIVIDFTPNKTSTKKQTTKQQTAQKKLRNIIIVLDPGHGGRDPGTTGPRGTQEKKVTLAIGLDLRRNLQTIPGIKVYMTRSKDIYPTLRQRLYLARRVKADIFISIHADAFKDNTTRGSTIFALSQGRATSEAARWIAERENKSELLGGINLNDKSYTLRSVLVDLSQTATIGSSIKLGQDILNQLKTITKLHSGRVEQASLQVLTAPDIPGILIETGFLSNYQEERLLRTRSYQQKIAKHIKQGIYQYLVHNPVPDTLFTARIFGTKYTVKKGDTLSTIARRFNVTLAQLKQTNTLKSTTLSIGQTLRIPGKR